MAEESMKKVGIFGGSFNPIHIGHLALANYLCEFSHLDEVWFMVSPQNPLKRNDKLWDDELRINLNVALKLGKLIQNNCKDVSIVYTREKDTFVGLDRRACCSLMNSIQLAKSVGILMNWERLSVLLVRFF